MANELDDIALMPAKSELGDITLRPAKRIVVLYLLVYLATIYIFALSLQHFSLRVGLESGDTLMHLWNVVALIGLVLLCYAALWRITCVYKVTQECVAGSTGILSRQHIRITPNRIVDYRIMRPLIERIIGLGDLHIATAGREGDELVMHQISDLNLGRVVLKLDQLLNQDQHKVEKALESAISDY